MQGPCLCPAGVALASQVGQSVGLALGCYASLAAFHLYTGYLAVRCVPLATLNPSRLELLIRLYLSQQQPRQDEQQEPVAAGQVAQPAAAAAAAPPPVASAARFQKQAAAGVAALPTPAELAGADPVFHQPVVCIGTPLRKLVQQHGDQLGQILQQQGHHQQQQMQQTQQRQQRDEGSPPPTAQLHLLVPAGERIHLLLHEQAEAADCILGFLHAYLVLHGGSSTHSSGSGPAVKQEQGAAVPAHAATSSSSGGDPAASMHHSLALARRLLPGLLAALEAAGWDDQKVVLEAKRRRVTW